MPKLKLPEGFYFSTMTKLVTETLPPLLGRLTADTAWRYIYAITMYSQVHDGERFLHLQESDKLGTMAGKEFARDGAEYLRNHLTEFDRCDPFELIDQVGKARNEAARLQNVTESRGRDQNVTGAAFETAVQVVIQRICESTPYRTPRLDSLQGFELAPIGYHSKPDLVLFDPRDFRLLISTKWTLRKERIGTYLHESYFYKRRRPDLQIAFVVNEFRPNILRWLSQDPLVDRVYHVNKAMLLHLYDPFAHLGEGLDVSRESLKGSGKTAMAYRQWLYLRERIRDLSDLFSDIHKLKSGGRFVPDPGNVAPEDEEDDDAF